MVGSWRTLGGKIWEYGHRPRWRNHMRPDVSSRSTLTTSLLSGDIFSIARPSTSLSRPATPCIGKIARSFSALTSRAGCNVSKSNITRFMTQRTGFQIGFYLTQQDRCDGAGLCLAPIKRKIRAGRGLSLWGAIWYSSTWFGWDDGQLQLGRTRYYVRIVQTGKTEVRAAAG